MRTVLALAFLVVPIAEIWLLIQVGQVIGGWQTLILLIAMSLLGAWLVRREGRRSWLALNESLRSGRMPGRELADAGLVLVGGTLLLTPGFLTDALGLFFIIPLTRPLARRALAWLVGRRLARSIAFYGPGAGPLGGGYRTGGTWPPGGPNGPAGGGPRPPGEVIEGEIVDN